ncbi:hypothetical protein [Bacillus toyonensis]|uniref:hypothetical protein n=1 Tax=Bacillus toyonensis TaxID=155322 RepID=UPI0015968C29|nr:hypothetical protein [Bacillus toyonensis]
MEHNKESNNSNNCKICKGKKVEKEREIDPYLNQPDFLKRPRPLTTYSLRPHPKHNDM